MKLLFINHGLGTRCGVFSYGLRVFDALKDSPVFDAAYAEPVDLEDYLIQVNEHHPDVVIFNYMQMLLPWLDCPYMRAPRSIKHIVLQHLFDNESVVPIMQSYGTLFDYMMITDPSLPVNDPHILKTGRPIPKFTAEPARLGSHVNVGSFGFSMPHKQFHLIAREVNRCFDNATFNLHMTVGDFTGDYSQGILESVEAELTKPGVILNYTSSYLNDDEIVAMMSKNDINALFYALPPDMAGLSSAADFMVAAQRPLLVTDCASFKHVYHGTFQYPSVSFDTIVGNYDWCANHSYELYERLAGKLCTDVEEFLGRIL